MKAKSVHKHKAAKRVSLKEKTKKTLTGKFIVKCVTEVAFRFKGKENLRILFV